MDAETPLHARVAETLGWTDVRDRGDGLVIGKHPASGLVIEVPPYGRTWCSTGPLIERYRILLGPEFTRDAEHTFAGEWSAMLASERIDATICRGATPCEAVGKLIVELHEKGKLPA